MRRCNNKRGLTECQFLNINNVPTLHQFLDGCVWFWKASSERRNVTVNSRKLSSTISWHLSVMANKQLVRHCEKQNICANWHMSRLFTLHHLLYLGEFCEHRECVLSPSRVLPVICCTIQTWQIWLYSSYQSQQWSTYLCSPPAAVASGHNLSTDSGTIFCQHLSPALMAKSASCIKTCLRRKKEKEKNISQGKSCQCPLQRCYVCIAHVSACMSLLPPWNKDQNAPRLLCTVNYAWRKAAAAAGSQAILYHCWYHARKQLMTSVDVSSRS